MNKQILKESLSNLRATALHALLNKNNINANYDDVYAMVEKNNDELTYKYFEKRNKKTYIWLIFLLILLFAIAVLTFFLLKNKNYTLIQLFNIF